MKYLVKFIWAMLCWIIIIFICLGFIIANNLTFLWHLDFKHPVSWNVLTEHDVDEREVVTIENNVTLDRIVTRVRGDKNIVETYLRLYHKIDYFYDSICD